MILVDTSVWVDHLRHGNDRLSAWLETGEVIGHPFVTGELACGTLRNRAEILSLLGALPAATVADAGEVLGLIEHHRLMGRGLGYVDTHLLASAMIDGSSLWSLDQRLAGVARALKVGAL